MPGSFLKPLLPTPMQMEECLSLLTHLYFLRQKPLCPPDSGSGAAAPWVKVKKQHLQLGHSPPNGSHMFCTGGAHGSVVLDLNGPISEDM